MRKLDISPSRIEAWVAKHFEYKKRSNGELIICNPFDNDVKYKFNISPYKQLCHDWRPGHQEHDGSFVRFVQRYKRISFHEAIKEICGGEVDLRAILANKEDEQEQPAPIEGNIELPSGAIPFREQANDKLSQIASQYLESRGVSIDVALKHNLHFGPGKIYFPYFEYGVQVYWQARDIWNKRFEFPSKEATIVGKESFLYGFDDVEPGDPVIINESIFDSLILGIGAVASGGAGLTKKQCKKVRALAPGVIILAPDRDYEGVISVLKNKELLEAEVDCEIKFVVPPDPYKDWNQMNNQSPRKYVDENARLASTPAVHPILESIA